jgi:hypothetical protein
MSCAGFARNVVLICAGDIERQADHIGILRSVEATEASRWLREVAAELRAVCGDDSPPDLAHSEEKL